MKSDERGRCQYGTQHFLAPTTTIGTRRNDYRTNSQIHLKCKHRLHLTVKKYKIMYANVPLSANGQVAETYFNKNKKIKLCDMCSASPIYSI